MKRSAPLERRTPLRGGGPLRRLTPLRASGRRGSSALKARDVVCDRANGWCEIRVSGVCAGRGTEAHHRLPRAQGGPDHVDNLAWTCWACHRFVHEHPEWSYALGFLLRRLAG